MGLAISTLAAVTSINSDDVFEIEQSVVSKRLTSSLFVSQLLSSGTPNVVANNTIVPQIGDVLKYDGTDFVSGETPRWRVIHQNAYNEASVNGGYQIVFEGLAAAGGIYLKASDYFEIGDPVRVVVGGITYYGMCYAVTTSALWIYGGRIPTGAITSLAVGTKDMIQHVEMRFEDATYNASSTLVLTKGCQHRWIGATGYLCLYQCAHMGTSATTVVQLQMNGGSDCATTGVLPGAGTATTYGQVATASPADLIQANIAIAHGQTITAKTPTVGGSASYLIINMTFVVP